MDAQAVVIVLATGPGSRFHGVQPKAAAGPGGMLALQATLRNALASRLAVVVVTTAAFADLARGSVAARDVVVLPEAATINARAGGMGQAVAAGVVARPHAAGWVVLPGDMPAVRGSTLNAVAEQLGEHAVAFAQYRGMRGHPVGFSAELYSELAVLAGDEGARRLLARYPAIGVEVDDPGVLMEGGEGLDPAAPQAEPPGGRAPRRA